VGRAVSGFPASSAIANRVGSYHRPHAMRSATPQPALVGASPAGEPSGRLRRTKPCKAGTRAVPATKRGVAFPTRNLSLRQSRRVPPSGPLSAGEGSDWGRSDPGREPSGPLWRTRRCMASGRLSWLRSGCSLHRIGPLACCGSKPHSPWSG